MEEVSGGAWVHSLSVSQGPERIHRDEEGQKSGHAEERDPRLLQPSPKSPVSS